MASVEACKVPRPGGWKHTLVQEEPRGTEDSNPQHTRLSDHVKAGKHQHTHTNVERRRVSLSNTHTWR